MPDRLAGDLRLAALPTHIVIPDTQVKPGVPTDHLRWIGRYIAEKYVGRENVTLIHLGDHWDMPSLSSYDKGKRAMEGRRYADDIQAGNDALALLDKPIVAAERRKHVKAMRRIILRGNHEHRVERAAEDNAQLEGTVTLDDMDCRGWERIPFLQPIWLDGVMYAHYFYNPMNGRPYSGMIETRIKNVGATFTQGHQQGYKHGVVPIMTASGPNLRHGLIAGSCYLHEEDYMGYQGNAYWRGIVVCYGVEDGHYDPKFVSLDSLCRRYEGVPLSTFLPGFGLGGTVLDRPAEDPGAINNQNGA